MSPDQIIEHIDEWLNEQAWRLAESEIDFALDIRHLIAALAPVDEPVLTNA